MKDEYQSPTITCGAKDILSGWAVAAAVILCLLGISSVQEKSGPVVSDSLMTEHHRERVIDIFVEELECDDMVHGWVGWGHSAALVVT